MAKEKQLFERRKQRVRTKIRRCTKGRVRLSVARSLNHISVQLIDDTKGLTLVAASSMEKELKLKSGGNIEAAKKIGTLIAERAKKLKVGPVVFDRGGFVYHGRVKALAEAARENGLEF